MVVIALEQIDFLVYNIIHCLPSRLFPMTMP